jgi:hypothetical protein
MEKPEDANHTITFTISLESRIRTAVYRGIVNDEQLLNAYAELIAAPDFDPALDDIVDLREANRLDISMEGFLKLVNLLSQLDRLGFQTKVAIVASTEMAYGMGRMYELMRSTDENSSEEIRVFRDYDEALRWLRQDKPAEGVAEDKSP